MLANRPKPSYHFSMTIRPANINPYHSDYRKSHVFDRDEVALLIRTGFNIIAASEGIAGMWVDEPEEEPSWEFPMLIAAHQETAEVELSSILLRLASSYRALDDQLVDDPAFSAFKQQQLDEAGGFLTTYGDAEIADNLRECCNKIIHADDLRPVYDNANSDANEGVWSMTGEIELCGRFRKTDWHVSFLAFKFFEALLETATHLDGTAVEATAGRT